MSPQLDMFAGAEGTLLPPPMARAAVPAPAPFFRQARAREYERQARVWLTRARAAKRITVNGAGPSADDIAHYVHAARRCWRNARRYERGNS